MPSPVPKWLRTEEEVRAVPAAFRDHVVDCDPAGRPLAACPHPAKYAPGVPTLIRRWAGTDDLGDPMAGSGTCRDVCNELGIACLSWDIHDGFDACDPTAFSAEETFDFIWAHPAYWRQKLYADDPRDLSRAPTLVDFLRRYGQFIRNAAKALKPGGKLAILMGDYCDRDAGFVPLTYHTKRLAFDAGLHQTCTDIIRFSHGASSSRKVYRSAFIPGLHDVCMVFEKVEAEARRAV
mgnify:CR=1 FL=1